jgi:polyferredoxin
MSTNTAIKEPIQDRTDLFRYRWVAALARSKNFLLVLQIFTVLLLAWAIYDGFFGRQSATENFSAIGITLLWPIFTIPALFLVGRIFCGFCPMGAINGAVERFGLKKAFPNGLRQPFMVFSVVLFVLAIWTIEPQLGTRSVPRATAAFLAAGGLIAATMGLVYKGRAICRLCPISVPLSVLTHFSPVEVRADKDICKTCTSHDCVNGNKDVEGCPVGLYPGALKDSSQCVYCTKCFKACQKNSVKLHSRWPGSGWLKPASSWSQGFTALALVGIFPIMMTFMTVKGTVFDWPLKVTSSATAGLFNWGFSSDAVHAMSTLLGILYIVILFTLAAFASSKLLKISLKRSFLMFSLPYALSPMTGVLGQMVLQNILKSSGGYLMYMADVFGLHYYQTPNIISTTTQASMQTAWQWFWIAATFSAVALVIFLIARKEDGARRGLLATLPHMAVLGIIAFAIYSQRFFPISL